MPLKLNCRLKSTYIESFGAFPDECPGGYKVTKLPIGAYSIWKPVVICNNWAKPSLARSFVSFNNSPACSKEFSWLAMVSSKASVPVTNLEYADDRPVGTPLLVILVEK